jgi:hypothetical protein
MISVWRNIVKLRIMFALPLAIILPTSLALAEEPNQLDEPLKPLAPLLGKTWKGEFKNSTPEKPLFDVMRWERALNGKAVRVLHSVNDGAYGGETLIIWDAKKKCLAYWYFTTAGFRTEGTFTQEDGQIISHEIVEGAAGGVTEVKSTMKIHLDGRVFVKTEHLKDGKWVPGREMYYKESPDAKVNFK